jgi:hypothetical protein
MWSDPAGDPAALRPVLKGLLGSALLHSTVSMNAISGTLRMLLLWASSAIGVRLLLDFGRQFNKAPDCFSTRREVGLVAAPVVYCPQKLLRYPHLKQAILRAFRWAATGPVATGHFDNFCLDIKTSKV